VEDYENDYVRLLLTKTFQKNVCKKLRRKSSWISFREMGRVNEVLYLLSFASYFDVNKHKVCQHPQGWCVAKVPSGTWDVWKKGKESLNEDMYL
jgi:hypothetical protein